MPEQPIHRPDLESLVSDAIGRLVKRRAQDRAA